VVLTEAVSLTTSQSNVVRKPEFYSLLHAIESVLRLQTSQTAGSVQGGPKSCTFSTHHIFGTVHDKMKGFHQNVPRVSGNKV